MRRLLLLLFCIFGFALFATATTSATTILNEPFDYADNAALNAVWNAFSSNPDYSLDTAFGNGEPSYAMPSPAGNFQGRLAQNLPGGSIQATDAEFLRLTFDLFLESDGEPDWNGARHYVELRGYSGGVYGSGDLENLLAMGLNNNSDDTFDTTFYQGRVTFGSNWNTLDEEVGAPNRSAGWHEMAIEINSTEVRFSVDGVLAEVEGRPNNFQFDSVVLGADLTAGGNNVWVDNVRLEQIPEPSTLALIPLAVLGLAVASRRRK